MIRKWIRNVTLPIFLLLCLKSTKKIEFNTRESTFYEYKNANRLTMEPKNSDNSSYRDCVRFESDEKKKSKLQSLTNGIFWSDYAEAFVQKGLAFNESMKLIKKFRIQRVKSVYRANQNICGSGNNGIITLEDDTRMCARNEKYKLSVYAEALTFYLSRLLRMDNIPEIILVSANDSSERWNGLNLSALNWKDNQTVALIKWLPNARSKKTFMPQLIQHAYKTGQPVTNKTLHFTKQHESNPYAIAELIQWGTIIIFDNLIGHYDRLIKYQPLHLHGIREESLVGSLYNSLKTSNGKIWLIDNESAFFYQSNVYSPIHKYIKLLKFNERMLRTMCVFQSSFVNELRILSRQKSAFQFLLNYAFSFEQLLVNVKRDPGFDLFCRIFDTRLGQILEWIDYCESVLDAK